MEIILFLSKPNLSLFKVIYKNVIVINRNLNMMSSNGLDHILYKKYI